MKKFITIITFLAFVISAPVFASEKGSLMEAQIADTKSYTIDVSHSTLGFVVKHMGVGKTRGAFDEYNGTISYDADTQEFGADITINVSSIDTDNEKRDNHLRGADFFDVENYPEITFSNARLKEIDGKKIIFGELTIKGVTKTITIPAEISGPVQGMKGGLVIGIVGSTTINRQDFNVSWSKLLDNGGLVVDNNVELILEIEAKAG